MPVPSAEPVCFVPLPPATVVTLPGTQPAAEAAALDVAAVLADTDADRESVAVTEAEMDGDADGDSALPPGTLLTYGDTVGECESSTQFLSAAGKQTARMTLLPPSRTYKTPCHIAASIGELKNADVPIASTYPYAARAAVLPTAPPPPANVPTVAVEASTRRIMLLPVSLRYKFPVALPTATPATLKKRALLPVLST